MVKFWSQLAVSGKKTYGISDEQGTTRRRRFAVRIVYFSAVVLSNSNAIKKKGLSSIDRSTSYIIRTRLARRYVQETREKRVKDRSRARWWSRVFRRPNWCNSASCCSWHCYVGVLVWLFWNCTLALNDLVWNASQKKRKKCMCSQPSVNFIWEENVGLGVTRPGEYGKYFWGLAHTTRLGGKYERHSHSAQLASSS